MTVACRQKVAGLGRLITEIVRMQWRISSRAYSYLYHVSCLYLPAFSMLSR